MPPVPRATEGSHALPWNPADTPLPEQRASDDSLVQMFRSGDQDAAAALFERYAARVRSLVQSRCTANYATRFDADDIVQSVFRSFFQGVRGEHYHVPENGELWGLLLVLALNKIRGQVDFHRAAKRNVLRTVPGELNSDALFTDEQTSGFMRMVIDDLLTDVPESNRQIVHLRIEGFDVKEIAERCGRSRRTVERVLQDFRKRLDPVE